MCAVPSILSYHGLWGYVTATIFGPNSSIKGFEIDPVHQRTNQTIYVPQKFPYLRFMERPFKGSL